MFLKLENFVKMTQMFKKRYQQQFVVVLDSDFSDMGNVIMGNVIMGWRMQVE